VVGDVAYAPCLSGLVKTQVTPGAPPTISVLWRSATGAGGSPVVAGGLVWVIAHVSGMLYGLDPATGAAAQSFSLGSISTSFPTPTVADGLLLAASDTQVHAFQGPAGLPPAPSPPPPTSLLAPVVALHGTLDTLSIAGADSGALWQPPSIVGVPGTTTEKAGICIGAGGTRTVSVQGPGGSLWIYWESSDAHWHGPLGVGDPGSTLSSPSSA
jgi:hypothetical protein